MLLVLRRLAVSHTFVHEVSKMADGTTSPKERFTESWHLMGEAPGKKMASRTAGKLACSTVTTEIFEGY